MKIGPINQEDIKSINIYAPNSRVPKLMRQMLKDLKGEIHNTKPHFQQCLEQPDRRIRKQRN